MLKDVRYWDENGSTRLAIDLSDAVPYHTYSGQDGRQITIVFFGAQSAETLLAHPIVASHDENLGSVRVSYAHSKPRHLSSADETTGEL